MESSEFTTQRLDIKIVPSDQVSLAVSGSLLQSLADLQDSETQNVIGTARAPNHTVERSKIPESSRNERDCSALGICNFQIRVARKLRVVCV